MMLQLLRQNPKKQENKKKCEKYKTKCEKYKKNKEKMDNIKTKKIQKQQIRKSKI